MSDPKPTRLSDKFLLTAKQRLAHIGGGTEADLRRATSDLYYALFHRICESLVEPMGVPAEPERKEFQELFRLIYRLPDHAYTSGKCREIQSQEFCKEIKMLARLFSTMRSKRELADYDPLQKFAISQVTNDVQAVESALAGLEGVDALELTRFAYYVSLKGNRKIEAG